MSVDLEISGISIFKYESLINWTSLSLGLDFKLRYKFHVSKNHVEKDFNS